MYSNICWFHIHVRQTSAWITAQQDTASLQSSVWIETLNYPYFSFFKNFTIFSNNGILVGNIFTAVLFQYESY